MSQRSCLGAQATVLARWSVVVLGVLVAASCTADAGAPPPQPSRGESPASVTSPAPSDLDIAQEAAVAAYQKMWLAMARAGVTSDWRSPELARYATGDALTALTKSLYADQANGVVTRGAPVLSPVVRSAEPAQDPATVVIDDCGDSSQWLKYFEGTDTPAGEGGGGGRRAITAEVLQQPVGSWRVARFAVQGVGTC